MLYLKSNLTEQEEKVRDIMLFKFNPALKFIFLDINPMEFKRYGFNSCRQTAILGAGYLRKVLPEYTFNIYEGEFIDTEEDGRKIPYIHAFIIAEKDNRKLLIDISRTEKPMLFIEISDDDIYPKDNGYDKVKLVSKTQLDLNEMLNPSIVEYYTSKTPQELLRTIEEIINVLNELPKYKQEEFSDMIYTLCTELRR